MLVRGPKSNVTKYVFQHSFLERDTDSISRYAQPVTGAVIWASAATTPHP
jgi:hypothetical protein